MARVWAVEIKPNMAEVSGNLTIVHNGDIFGHFKKLNPKPVNNSSICILCMEVTCQLRKWIINIGTRLDKKNAFFFQAIAMIR